jgi:DNA-binding NarL/FixJ family response regulator
MLHASARTQDTCKAVLVVDDHPIVRRGVRAIVGEMAGFRVVGESDNGFDAIGLAQSLNPDIIVMNLSMPGLGGVEAVAELRRRLPGAEVLIFSRHQGDQMAADAIAAGARGYVCKAESEHLAPALNALARNRRYVSPGVAEALSCQTQDQAWDRRPLTTRERQVVKFVAEGHSNKAISRLLQISVKTTETHRAAAMRKTGTNSIAGLTLYAARNQLVAL